MKKIVLFMISILLTMGVMLNASFACSSFAEYSDTILYGMNFDYTPTEIRLNYYKDDKIKVFYSAFQEGHNFYLVSGMNDKGLFLATQIQSPALAAKQTLAENEIYIGELGGLIGESQSVEDVYAFIEGKRLAPSRIPIHMMFADKSGRSVIVEAGEEENELITTDENFMVMTNFRNADFVGKPYNKVSGAGADRYIAAYETILNSFNDFNLEKAWDVLQKTLQKGHVKTLSSSVFDPVNQEIYIAFDGNLNKVWKVSLEKGTIETYKGFEKSYSLPIGEGGILVSALKAYQQDEISSQKSTGGQLSDVNQTKAQSDNVARFIGIILLLIAAIASGILSLNKTKSDNL